MTSKKNGKHHFILINSSDRLGYTCRFCGCKTSLSSEELGRLPLKFASCLKSPVKVNSSERKFKRANCRFDTIDDLYEKVDKDTTKCLVINSGSDNSILKI